MDFKQIEAFISVSKHKNFSKAAKAMYLSQPTVSLHISNLEKELGVVLFDRNSKMVELTQFGEKFLEYALDMENTKIKAINAVSKINTDISGLITISTSTTPNIVIIPKLIKEFNTTYPDVKYNIKEMSSDYIVDDIIASRSEIGFIGRNISHEKINSFKLESDEIVFIASKDLNIPLEISIDDLFLYNFINRTKYSATRQKFESRINEYMNNDVINNVHNICETDNISTIIQLVKSNVGISYISKGIYESYIDQSQIKLFSIKGVNFTRNIYAITNSKRTLSPATESFLKSFSNKE